MLDSPRNQEKINNFQFTGTFSIAEHPGKQREKKLYFPAFCDTILILRKLAAKNSRWNINKFANVIPAKAQKIQPHIIGFVEWE